jgi:hypothetical protein
MIFNAHSHLEGKHAFLSPSNYHWINYSEDKLAERFISSMAARRGTELHDFAHEAIRLGIRLPEAQTTLSMYVNDGIGYKMEVEQALYYSPNCFGHADTLAFRNGFLRIHDLKTGTIPGSPHQLMIYAALFCLEYIITPFEIDVELRIYQNDEVQSFSPFPETVSQLMDKIILFDQKVNQLKEEGAW